MKKLLIIVIIIMQSCKTTQVIVPVDFTNYEVKALNQGTQGTVLMKVYSYGYTIDNAIERAKMDAVHAVLFKGVSGSNSSRPIVLEGQEVHKEYFDDFFGLYKVEKGRKNLVDPFSIDKVFNAPYKMYVQLSNDGSIDPSDRLKVGNKYKVGVVVSVNLTELRGKMENDKIINKLNSGF